MKASRRACNVRTFSEVSNSIAVSSLKGPDSRVYDLFIALPIECLPGVRAGSGLLNGPAGRSGRIPLERIMLLLPLGRAHEFQVADTERGRQFVNASDRRIPPSLLKSADVLLAEAGNLGQLLLCQALFLSDPLDVPPDPALCSRWLTTRRMGEDAPFADARGGRS